MWEGTVKEYPSINKDRCSALIAHKKFQLVKENHQIHKLASLKSPMEAD